MGGALSALVLLHGFTGSPAMWAHVIERLQTAVAVFAPWLSGHGAHPVSKTTTFEDEVDRLAALIHARQEQKPHLVGYSLGARLAVGLLARHPETFSGATLIGLNPGLTSDREREERARNDARWLALLEEQGAVAFATQWEAQALFSTQNRCAETTLEQQRRIRRSHQAEGLAHSLRACGLARMPDWRPALADLPHRITFVAGEEDTRFSALARECAQLAPRGRSRIVAEAGHNVVLERPDAIASLLNEEDT